MTDKETIALLDQALGEAFVIQFNNLFGVLMAADDLELGLERFQRGLTKLLDTATAVLEIIRQQANDV